MLVMDGVSIGINRSVLINSSSIRFDSSMVYGVLAPNGYGKTTLFRALGGDRKLILSGCISADEVRAGRSDAYKSLVFFPTAESLMPYKTMRVSEMVRLIPALWHKKIDRRILALINKVDLSEMLNLKISELSDGMIHKLIVAIALAAGSKYLLLDEPLNAMDFNTAKNISIVLKDYALLGNTVVISSHLLDACDGLCDEYVLIENGALHMAHSMDGARMVYEKAYVKQKGEWDEGAATCKTVFNRNNGL